MPSCLSGRPKIQLADYQWFVSAAWFSITDGTWLADIHSMEVTNQVSAE
jgi:hypothetical protein